MLEILLSFFKAYMELLHQIWETLVAWWDNICKKPEVEDVPVPLDPREKVHELDIDELSKVIYYFKPKQT